MLFSLSTSNFYPVQYKLLRGLWYTSVDVRAFVHCLNTANRSVSGDELSCRMCSQYFVTIFTFYTLHNYIISDIFYRQLKIEKKPACISVPDTLHKRWWVRRGVYMHTFISFSIPSYLKARVLLGERTSLLQLCCARVSCVALLAFCVSARQLISLVSAVTQK